MAEEEKARTSTTSRLYAEQAVSEPKPIVLKYKKLKKEKLDANGEGKVKYSKGLGDIQRFEGNMVHISQKATRALAKGVDVYERERNKSAREKTDGAIEDFINNAAKATSSYLKESSDIPIDVAEAVSSSAYHKRLRKNLRRGFKSLRLFRI